MSRNDPLEDRSLPVIEGSCEYIEQEVAYSREGVAFQL